MNQIQTPANKSQFSGLFNALIVYSEALHKKYYKMPIVLSFSLLWAFFSYRKIPRDQGKAILSVWEGEGLIEIRPYHGIKFKVN